MPRRRRLNLPPPPANLPRQAAPPLRLPGKLVFQTAIGGDIYVVNADGTGLRRVTDGIDPILSPDGTQLAFARWGSPAGVFVLDLRTGEERRVATVDRPRSPIWSPDGSKLAFTHVTKSTECRATPFGCLSDDELRSRFGGRTASTRRTAASASTTSR